MDLTTQPKVDLGQFGIVFESAPVPYVILLPDAPVFTIAAANDAFARAVGRDRMNYVGKGLFEAFPNTHTLNGVPHSKIVYESLMQAIETGRPQVMDVQRYDLLKPGHLQPMEKYWRVVNTPVAEYGAVKYIAHAIMDVTQDVATINKVRIEEERFKNMVKQAPVAMGVLRGTELIIESANDALLQIWGKGNEVIGLPLLHGLPEIADQPFPALLQQVYETGKPYYGFETLAKLERNGVLEDCYFNFVYAPYLEATGEISGVMLTANEVTATVRTKKELEVSEKRFRNLIEETDVATAMYVGEEMVIQLANDAMLNLWGKDASVIGKPLHKALPELEGQPFLELLHDVYTTGTTYKATEDRADLEIGGILKTGYFNFSYKALRNADGKIYAILNMAVDVTDLVLERRKVKEGEERLKIATEGTGIATWDLDLTANKIIYTPRLNEIFGYPKSKVFTHQELVSYIHPNDAHILEDAWKQAEKTGLYSYEARIVWPDNSIHWIKTRGRVIFDDASAAQRMLGVMMDITEQRRVSEDLKASEERYRKLAEELEHRIEERTHDLRLANAELIRSNEELEQFAFVTSHDLQEPLRKIRTFSNMLMEKNPELLNERGRLYLEKINTSASRMSELIKALLNFSRIRHSSEALKIVNLNDVLDDVLIDFELLIKQKNAMVRNEGLPSVEAIPLQMNQLFYNLLSNALKFTKPQGLPEIICSSRIVSGEELKDYPTLGKRTEYVEISISDNGIGFDQEYADKIFEIFQRLNDKSEYEGTGIGLALCNKIVINHKGAISVKAEQGIGATFYIILPLKQK